MNENEQSHFLDQATIGPRSGERPIPEGAGVATCASCKAAIVWIRTEAGRAMPLSLATANERDGIRYALPHFADCPESKQWSRKGKR